MKKRYVCFTCYKIHPDWKGVTEEEFNAGNNVCQDEKCVRKSQPFEPALLCEHCQKLFNLDEKHSHVF